eukprot:CFRG0327T1
MSATDVNLSSEHVEYLQKNIHLAEALMGRIEAAIDTQRNNLCEGLEDLATNGGDQSQIESLYQAIKASVKLDLENRCHLQTLKDLKQTMGPYYIQDNLESMVDDFEKDLRKKKDSITDAKVQGHEWTTEALEILREKLPEKYGGDDDASKDSDQDFTIDNVKESYMCSLTLRLFDQPLKNKDCSHRFNKDGIYGLLAKNNNKTIRCPTTGCGANITKASLIKDSKFERGMKRALRVQAMEGGEEDIEIIP